MSTLLDSALAILCVVLACGLLLLAARPAGWLVVGVLVTSCAVPGPGRAGTNPPTRMAEPVRVRGESREIHCGDSLPGRAITTCSDCHDDRSRSL